MTATNRRTMLKSASVAIGLPWLESVSIAAPKPQTGQQREIPARLAFVYVPNGVNIKQWLPADTGPNFELSPTLEPLRDLRKHVSVLSGFEHASSKGGHAGADTWLTGADLSGTPGYDYRNSISADQVAAQHLGQYTRFPSLELSSDGGTGKPGHSHTLSYTERGTAIPSLNSPRQVFNRLFRRESSEQRQRISEEISGKRSILDVVLEQARQLHRAANSTDRAKIDEYLNSVREVERRVQRSEAWLAIEKPQVDASNLDLNSSPYRIGNRQTFIQTMFDLMFLALQSDVTRVATFQIGREASGGYYRELGISAMHHELSHHGGDPKMLNQLQQIDNFLIEQFANFLKRLHDVTEGGHNMLANTLIMYGSGMDSGDFGGHSPKNLPTLLAGGQSLGIRGGQHIQANPNSPQLSNVLATALHAVNVPAKGFSDSTTLLTPLLK